MTPRQVLDGRGLIRRIVVDVHIRMALTNLLHLLYKLYKRAFLGLRIERPNSLVVRRPIVCYGYVPIRYSRNLCEVPPGVLPWSRNERGGVGVGRSREGGSRIYPILAPYQREGYQALMKIASKYKGAFLCDGVGLGKTFIGLMLIERLIEHDRKRVALFVPKAARKPVWESALKKYLPNIRGAFANLEIFTTPILIADPIIKSN
ncbi:hypothetical protein BH18ACI4_BH18ACI4_24830 [soil metagenome]